MSADDAKEQTASGLFEETPLPGEKHPVTYMQIIGASIQRYRHNLPKGARSHQHVGDRLRDYVGTTVSRARIARIERGDVSPSIGIYAAIWNEMGVLPKIAALCHGHNMSNMQAFMALGRELAVEAAEAARSADYVLRLRAAADIQGLNPEDAVQGLKDAPERDTA